MERLVQEQKTKLKMAYNTDIRFEGDHNATF
jgi:hypothetical protein